MHENNYISLPFIYILCLLLTFLTHRNAFTLLMLQDWDRQSAIQIFTEMCGFVTILAGTFLLHKTKDMVEGGSSVPPSIVLIHISFKISHNRSFVSL